MSFDTEIGRAIDARLRPLERELAAVKSRLAELDPPTATLTTAPAARFCGIGKEKLIAALRSKELPAEFIPDGRKGRWAIQVADLRTWDARRRARLASSTKE